MSLLYSIELTNDGSYKFISEQGHVYLVYFLETAFPDSENNVHIIYNVGFSRNGKHDSNPFMNKYDGRVEETILFIINDFFRKNDHLTLIYFCFGDDGYSRNRNIVFNKWSRRLTVNIEKHNRIVPYDNTLIYGSLIIVKDNPLKKLILDSFDSYLEELKNMF